MEKKIQLNINENKERNGIEEVRRINKNKKGKQGMTDLKIKISG